MFRCGMFETTSKHGPVSSFDLTWIPGNLHDVSGLYSQVWSRNTQGFSTLD
jgi:hypothetical protein